MRIDVLTMHSEDINSGSGVEFYGTPILEASDFDVDVREGRDRTARISLSTPSQTIELLPGEVITRNLIRRSTAAEVIGEEFYKKDVVMEGGRRVSIAQAVEETAKLITWRPNGENFAYVHEETNIELSA